MNIFCGLCCISTSPNQTQQQTQQNIENQSNVFLNLSQVAHYQNNLIGNGQSNSKLSLVSTQADKNEITIPEEEILLNYRNMTDNEIKSIKKEIMINFEDKIEKDMPTFQKIVSNQIVYDRNNLGIFHCAVNTIRKYQLKEANSKKPFKNINDELMKSAIKDLIDIGCSKDLITNILVASKFRIKTSSTDETTNTMKHILTKINKYEAFVRINRNNEEVINDNSGKSYCPYWLNPDSITNQYR